jgi:hypothetical protein
MTLPNFLCIGAQRAGTTWLYKILSRHPDIFLSAQKELHFFDEQQDFSTYEGLGTPGRPFFYDMRSSADWRWYEDQFREAGKQGIRGEITPFYATLSGERVGLIARELLGLRIIYIIRNPVKRAWSGFRLFWFLQTKHQDCNLHPGVIEKTIMYPAKLIHGNYSRNTSVWEKWLRENRILYLFYDDIVEKPREVLDQAFSFLQVAPLQIEVADLAERVNVAPDASMPEPIERALANYYTDQVEFIKVKFGRVLQY